MDVSRTDIASLFELMDSSGDGLLSYHEFIWHMQRAQKQDMRVQMMVMKLQLERLRRSIDTGFSSALHEIKQTLATGGTAQTCQCCQVNEGPMYQNNVGSVNIPTCDSPKNATPFASPSRGRSPRANKISVSAAVSTDRRDEKN
ncbi:unnamed protein product [Polarella glacialis]|nr:unnamed protein product [Polarella glacialis]